MAALATPFEESPQALAWLRQFAAVDREVARQYLRSLRLVSESEFDREVQLQLEAVLNGAPAENFALFSVTEPPNPFVATGGRRTAGSSADRVKHLIENTTRVHGSRVSGNPTVESMRAQRIRNIVIVEDFIGSGKRVTDFWRELMSSSVKSWISLGWTKVWLVTYAGFEEGLRTAVRRIGGLKRDRIRTVLNPASTRLGLTGPMRDVFSRYGAAARNRTAGLGFGEGGCSIVFQHGCPNNSPLVLWEGTRRFRPLFPDRGIPATLHEYFEQPPRLERTELLWDQKQYMLALSLLKDIKQGSPNLDHWEFVVALGLSSRHSGWDDEWLSQRMRVSIPTIERLRRSAYSLNMIDTSSHKVTHFGHEFLVLLRRSVSPRPAIPKRARALPKLNDMYYPDSCGARAKH
jgi:hypothetical protein